MSNSDTSFVTAEMIRSHARLFDTEYQAVIATTVGGEIVYWSRSAETVYGWTAEEVDGLNIADVTPSSISRELGAQILRRLQQGRSWSGRFRVQSKTGEEFEVSVRDMTVRNDFGDLIGIVGISSRASSPQLQPAV